MPEMRSRLIDASFPQELLLEIIERLPFDKNLVPQLASVHPYIRATLAAYETSITKAFVKRSLFNAPTDFPTCKPNYSWLSKCDQQYDVADDLMLFLTFKHNRFAVERHNVSLVNTGLYLLYRLQDFERSCDTIAFLKALPRDPLTAMFAAINYSTMIARYDTRGIINRQTYGRFLNANGMALRKDMEFAFSEGALNLGPSFIAGTLLRAEETELIMLCLYHDHAGRDRVMQPTNANPDHDFQPPITEGPHRDPNTRSSLYTTLLERLGELYGWPSEDVASRLDFELDQTDHELAYLEPYEKTRIIAQTVFNT